MLRLVISKAFLINLLVAIVIIIAGIWGFMNYLHAYTHHGETITVPDFTGLKIQELNDFIDGKQLQFIITDSVHNMDQPRGTVVDQHPNPESQVKENRKIYLTVNALLPRSISMPNIEDVTLRQAMAILETYGIKIGTLNYAPDECTNCILGVESGGKTIQPGDQIIIGTALDLILGQGESNEMIPIPFLINMKQEEAITLLKHRGLNVGSEIFENCQNELDSSTAKVFRQNPAWGEDEMINLGKMIDLYYTNDPEKLILTANDSIPVVEEQED